MEVTIEDIKERQDFTVPSRIKTVVDVRYVTDKGFRGTVTLDKAGITADKIKAAAVADAAELHTALGQTIKR